ncbi:phage major capsid protein [Kitasatospora sp. NPDC090091]|uniref:phage major capsid protein n=1 Tax=Kitasatospora sp. NPDC090091 TaxID=3364081 RepID=UPI00382C367E
MSSTDVSLKTLIDELAARQSEARRISDTFKVDEKGRFTVSTEQNQAYRKVIQEAQELKSLIDSRKAADDIAGFLDAPDTPSAAGQFYGSAPSSEVKSLGDLFIESDGYERARERGFEGSAQIRAGMEGKSIWALSAGTVTHNSFGGAQNVGISELARRKARIRDLFPKSTTKASVLYGIRETGWTNNAAQVRQRTAADGTSPAAGLPSDQWGRAPESKLDFKPVMYPISEIAHVLHAHKNILSDEPRLKTFINGRMIEGVKYREDYDLLHSTGDGEKLTGLFNVPGVQEYQALQADKRSVQVRRAITKGVLAEYEMTGLVISPNLWEELELETDDTGAFRIAVAVAVGAERKVWRLGVVDTTAMADDKFLVGAFGSGAQLHDRESVSVTVSSENGLNFENGVISIRADERVALEVPRPESFVVGTWA